MEDDIGDDELEETSLYVIPAVDAPLAAVFCRAPEEWWMIARWDLETGDLERGAWLRGELYPRRCDVSPEGAVLYYFLAKESNRPFMGMGPGLQTFSAVSKLPWVYALAAWREDDEDVAGYHFVPRGRWDIGAPQHGDDGPLRARHGLALNEIVQYELERRRGWLEHERCPPRLEGDRWDELRKAILVKARPGQTSTRLVLEDRGYDPDYPGAFDGRAPEYRLEIGGASVLLDDVAWADWDARGRLLVATEDARLQIRELESNRVLVEHDLGDPRRRPGPAPAWAQRW